MPLKRLDPFLAYLMGLATGLIVSSIPPAAASDPGIIDRTGAANPSKGCAPQFIVNFPEHPGTAENINNSGYTLNMGPVCGNWHGKPSEPAPRTLKTQLTYPYQ